MLVIEETHAVIGRKVADFEALSRDVWMPALAQSDDCRLLWFFHLFTVYDAFGYVTITALRDGAAYEKHAERIQSGDLAEPAERLDACRYDVTSRIMTELPFAPLQVELADVPTTPNDATPAVYMEDTMYPIVGQLRPFEHALETIYFRELGTYSPLTIEAGFRSAPGGGNHPEVILLEKWQDPSWLTKLIARDGDAAPEPRPGTWMYEALNFRDRWKSRLLTTSPWSPLQ